MMVLRPDFASALGKVDKVFDHIMALDGEVLREMNGRRTLRFVMDGKPYFLKAHSGIGWREVFKNLMQLRWPVTGAANEWLAVQRLTELGIDTMTLVAYGRRGISPATQESFVITEELTDTCSLEELCVNWGAQGHTPVEQVRIKRQLIQRVAAIARNMHQNGVNHRDFYLCHFLLDMSQGMPATAMDAARLYLIDLHRMQLRRHTPARWKIKDIAALYFSSMDIGLTRRDLYRFMAVYGNVPLRVVLRGNSLFWNAVRRRALGLYRSFHGRDPLPKY